MQGGKMAKGAGKESTVPVVEATGALAKLVDEVMEGHAPIIVARDGEPKAALVSLDDYARLEQGERANTEHAKLGRQEWSREANKLREEILAYRHNEPIDFEKLVREMREDLEDRDAFISGN
jgi:prevent-host-death family protein